MSKQRSILESQITPQQKRAAQMMVANEWAELTQGEDGRKLSMQELADEIGVARSTLYEWKSQEAFGAYMNYLTDVELQSMRTVVYTALMKAILPANGQPSVKALDLYMRRHALLTDRTVVEDMRDTIDTRRKTDEEIRKEIDELDAMINGGK